MSFGITAALASADAAYSKKTRAPRRPLSDQEKQARKIKTEIRKLQEQLEQGGVAGAVIAPVPVVAPVEKKKRGRKPKVVNNEATTSVKENSHPMSDSELTALSSQQVAQRKRQKAAAVAGVDNIVSIATVQNGECAKKPKYGRQAKTEPNALYTVRASNTPPKNDQENAEAHARAMEAAREFWAIAAQVQDMSKINGPLADLHLNWTTDAQGRTVLQTTHVPGQQQPTIYNPQQPQ